MRKKTLKSVTLFITISLVIFFAGVLTVNALEITEIPYEFVSLTSGQLDWSQPSDDMATGSTALGFSVVIEGILYSYFDLNVNGYIGESTRRELEYAQQLGKRVRWLEPPQEERIRT